MSERKERFTPGPWVVYPVSVNSESCDIVKQDDTNDRISVTCEQSINAGRELANAHLIAAAPELYEALAVLFESYKRLADSGDAGFWKIEDTDEGKQAMSALAKARGEA